MESFGIDFGTTNSAAVGWSDQGRGRLFGWKSTDRPLPSVVAIHKITGELHKIGFDARDHREQLGSEYEVISSVKSWLGQPDKCWNIGPRVWKPEDIAAEIIKELRRSIRERLAPGEQLMKSAVFSIPVGCSMAQRKSLRRAARSAEIEVVSFISEPTAALCRHFKDNDIRQWSKIAVFDWGGGTLDISIVELRNDMVTEIATYGRHLGGDNLDSKLAEYLHDKIMIDRDDKLPFAAVKPEFRDLLTQRAELAKIALGTQNDVAVGLVDYCGSRAQVPLTLDTMLRLFEPFRAEAFDALQHTIHDQARCSFEEIGCLLMVGGTSKLRGLSEYFRTRGWPNHIMLPTDADWNIAQGAAIIASNPGNYVSAQDFGLAVSDGSCFPLIRDGQQIHINREQRHYFGLVEDSQEARIVFVQSTGANGYENAVTLDTLGYLSIPAYGFDNEPIVLKTSIDEDLVLNVHGHSTRRESQVRHWPYEKLRFRYKLPHGL